MQCHVIASRAQTHQGVLMKSTEAREALEVEKSLCRLHQIHFPKICLSRLPSNRPTVGPWAARPLLVIHSARCAGFGKRALPTRLPICAQRRPLPALPTVLFNPPSRKRMRFLAAPCSRFTSAAGSGSSRPHSSTGRRAPPRCASAGCTCTCARLVVYVIYVCMCTGIPVTSGLVAYMHSPRQGAPVLICPVPSPTTRSAMVVSSVSPLR